MGTPVYRRGAYGSPPSGLLRVRQRGAGRQNAPGARQGTAARGLPSASGSAWAPRTARPAPRPTPVGAHLASRGSALGSRSALVQLPAARCTGTSDCSNSIGCPAGGRGFCRRQGEGISSSSRSRPVEDEVFFAMLDEVCYFVSSRHAICNCLGLFFWWWVHSGPFLV